MGIQKAAGFTLIEMAIIIAIIGILSAIALPEYQHMVNKSRQSEAKANLTVLYSAERTFAADAGAFSTRFDAVGFKPTGMSYYQVGFSADVAPPPSMPQGSPNCIINAPPGTPPTDSFNVPNCPASYVIGIAYSVTDTTSISPGATVTANGFTAEARACLVGTAATDDVWQIDQSRVLVNTIPVF